jgi:probable phosphoglycerate mutase
MTAVPIAACSEITIEESPLLQERNFGDLRGMSHAELTEDPFGPNFVPPNGEDWSIFHARVAEAFALIVSRRRAVNGTLVVVHAWSSLPRPGRAARAGARRHFHSGAFR